MSSFFGKDQTEKNLQYDDIAFIHFLLSVCGAVAIALTLAIVLDILSQKRKPYSKLRKSGLFQNQIANQKRREGNYIFSGPFCIKFIILIGVVATVTVCSYIVSTQQGKMIGFDPYEILGVEYDAPVSKIKKSYRKLALEFHPDRNPNNPEVGAKFIMISKAYECLTDQKAKQNCLKYGNPDGQQSFKVGIGLPSFIISAQNQAYVIPIVFGILLVLIPSIFIRWNNNLRAKDQSGMLIANYPYLWNFFYPQFSISNVICMFACLRELNDPAKVLTDTKVKNLVVQIRKRPYIKQSDLQRTPPHCLQTLVQLLQHMEGKNRSQRIAKDFDRLSHQVLNFSLQFCKRGNHGKPLMDNPEWPVTWLGANILRLMVQFPRRFYNNLFGEPMSCPLQLLDLNQKELQIVRKNVTHNIQKDILQTEQKLDNFVRKFEGEDRRQYISKQLRNYPLISLEIKAFVQNNQVQKMSTAEIATIQFTVRKRNDTVGYCALKNYPYLKQEEFYFLFTYGGNLIHFQTFKFEAGKTQFTGKFTHQQEFAKKVEFMGRIVSDSYYGMDCQKPFILDVLNVEQQDQIEIHPEDLNIQKLPKTTLESLLSMDVQNESDKQMSDGQQDEEPPTVLNYQAKKQKKKNRQMEEQNITEAKQFKYDQTMHQQKHDHGCGDCCDD